MESLKSLPSYYLNRLAEHYIACVFSPPNDTGYLYFETSQLENIHSALNKVWTSPIRVLSIARTRLETLRKMLHTRKHEHTLTCHSWVRLKRGGVYKGDLGFVDSLEMSEGYANILLLPRLPSLMNSSSGRKRKRTLRHPQALFDSGSTTSAYESREAKEITHIQPPKRLGDDTWSYNDEVLYKGCCRRRVAVYNLNLSPAEPSENELFQWMDCTHEPIRRSIKKLVPSLGSASKQAFCSGDRVLVKSTDPDVEDFGGTIVFVEDIDNDPPTALVRSELTDEIQSYHISDLKKRIRVGDLMLVEGISNLGTTGTVLWSDGKVVNLLVGELEYLKQV